MAALIPVQCPACGDTETIVKFGRTHNEKQRYRCQSAECKKLQIERKHLTLRTRIKRLMRKTICFSKSERMHDIVIGLFINVHEFGLAI